MYIFFNSVRCEKSKKPPLISTSVMRKVCFGMPNVKVKVEGQMFKLTLSEA